MTPSLGCTGLSVSPWAVPHLCFAASLASPEPRASKPARGDKVQPHTHLSSALYFSGEKQQGGSAGCNLKAEMCRVSLLWLTSPVLLTSGCCCHPSCVFAIVTFAWLLRAARGSQHSGCARHHGVAARNHLSRVPAARVQAPGGFPLGMTAQTMPQTPGRVTRASCDFADLQVGGWLQFWRGKGQTEVNISTASVGGDGVAGDEEKGHCHPKPSGHLLQLGGECRQTLA